jgi:hypothetical protein
MKTIINRTRQPVRVQLGGGKVLHLGPAKTGQVADAVVELPSVRRMVAEGQLAILDGGRSSPASAGGDAPVGHESTHGHHPPTVVMPKGNR